MYTSLTVELLQCTSTVPRTFNVLFREYQNCTENRLVMKLKKTELKTNKVEDD
jgi:hypothetical protein